MERRDAALCMAGGFLRVSGLRDERGYPRNRLFSTDTGGDLSLLLSCRVAGRCVRGRPPGHLNADNKAAPTAVVPVALADVRVRRPLLLPLLLWRRLCDRSAPCQIG